MNKSEKAVHVFNIRAKEYANRFMDVSNYHDSLYMFLDSILATKPTVLELACGPGNITRFLLEKRPTIKILATDLAPNMLKIAKENNPTAAFKLLDCRKILELEQAFDGILCGFGLPYLTKEEAILLIEDASKMINSNGILYLSTMADDYSKSELKTGSTGDEIFIHYHQENYLAIALLKNGFDIIQIIRQSIPDLNDTSAIDLILIAKKK